MNGMRAIQTRRTRMRTHEGTSNRSNQIQRYGMQTTRTMTYPLLRRGMPVTCRPLVPWDNWCDDRIMSADFPSDICGGKSISVQYCKGR